MLININHRFNNSVLFAHDAEENSLKISLFAALKAEADLRWADLREADLRIADVLRAFGLNADRFMQPPRIL